jgi:hypothetical protein
MSSAGVTLFRTFFAAPIEEQLWAMMVPGLIASRVQPHADDYCWN